MKIKDELAARRTDAAHKTPESPDKARWMLWLPHDVLAALAEESKRLGTTRAQIVRDALGARMALTNDQISAYLDEAAERGVSLEALFAEALVAGTPDGKGHPPLAVAA